ncbi:MAG: IS110 family transposase [Nitrospirales bacterium]|nr:IS110 family transposase [Nitrospirales bacterium]
MNDCGIDLASEASAVCIVNEQGTLVREQMVATEARELGKALTGLGRLRCVVEAAPLAEWVAQELEPQGHAVIIIDPRQAKAVIQTKNKTDKLDARNLAKLAQVGWYTAVHRKTPAARLQRTHLQARNGLVETAQAQAARIRGLLRAHGVKVGAVSAGQFVATVQALVAEQVPALTTALEPLLLIYPQAQEGAKTLARHVTKPVKQDPICPRLMPVPGVGPLVAGTSVATLEDPTRFRTSTQVAAYLGLVPRVYQSGAANYHGRIRKEGDKLLRWLFVEAAHVLLTRTKRSCTLKRWGVKLAKKRGQGKANVAVARKLAILLHRLWMTDAAFTPEPG